MELIPLVVVATCLSVASATDFVQFKVYNLLTIPVFFGGLAYGIANGGWSGIGFAFAGAFTGFGILLIPYLMGGLGAGDVKYVMAIGTWIGAGMLLPAILVGCVVVFAYYLMIVARRQGASGVMINLQLMMARLSCFGRNLALNDQFETVQMAANNVASTNRGRLIPFSAMMSVGIVIVLILFWKVSTPS